MFDNNVAKLFSMAMQVTVRALVYMPFLTTSLPHLFLFFSVASPKQMDPKPRFEVIRGYTHIIVNNKVVRTSKLCLVL